MKKISYILLAVFAAFLLSSCGKESGVEQQIRTETEEIETLADVEGDCGEGTEKGSAEEFEEIEEREKVTEEIGIEEKGEEADTGENVTEEKKEEAEAEEDERKIEGEGINAKEKEAEIKEVETEEGETEAKEKEAETEEESPKVTDNSRWDWFIEPGEYLDIKLYDDNFIAVADSSNQYGFIDGEKNVIVKCQYAHVAGVSEQIARVMDSNNNYMFLNSSGKLITKEVFEDASDFKEGFGAVKKEGKWGFLNTSGKLVIACQYDYVTEFHEGLAAVKIDRSWHYIDKNGQMAFEGEYEDAQYFSEGLAAVKKDKKYGFIDKSGNVKIDFQYEEAGNFSEGKAAAAKVVDGSLQWAYINAENEVVLDYELYYSTEGRMELVGAFQDGYALVARDLYCLIDEEGRTVLGKGDHFFLTGDSTYSVETGWMPAYDYTDDSMTEKKYGFVGIDGRIKVPFLFESISGIYGDLAEVRYEQEGESKTGVIKLALRSYDSHRDFPYGHMDFVDEKAYAFLKKIYDEIDFTGEFQTGNLDLYDEYKEEFKKLLNNEISFIELETGEEYYINDYAALREYDEEKFETGEFEFCMFDMDGDTTPELCIRRLWYGQSYVFKYYKDYGEMALWMENPSPNEQVHGTKALNWNWEGVRYCLTRLNERGECVFWVYFLLEGSWSNGIETYLVALPYFCDREQIEIPVEMEKQGYFSEDDNRYLFQVTEEQFDELTQNYFDACKKSEEERKKITFTYEELFETDEKYTGIGRELIDWTWFESADEYGEADHKSYEGVEVSVERTSRTITNGEGETLAEIYYERPVVSNSWAARKINQFFKQEEREWFLGEGRNTLYGDQNFLSFYTQLNELCELFGENCMIKNPFRYTMSTKILFLDNELLSILQIASIENRKQTSHYYFGSTFDMKSGELLSITELTDIDADRLGDLIENALPDDKTYHELRGDNYLIHYNDDVIAMDYEYFYDGMDFYIILNRSAKAEGFMIKWDGK